MPLLFPSSGQSPESVLSSIPSSTSSSSPHYLVFLSSVDPSSGQMWCGDCRDTQSTIEQLVPDNQSQLVFVGEKQESVSFPFPSPISAPFLYSRFPSRNRWKSPDSPWRKAPFNLKAIPTIIKVEESSKDSLQSSVSLSPALPLALRPPNTDTRSLSARRLSPHLASSRETSGMNPNSSNS